MCPGQHQIHTACQHALPLSGILVWGACLSRGARCDELVGVMKMEVKMGLAGKFLENRGTASDKWGTVVEPSNCWYASQHAPSGLPCLPSAETAAFQHISMQA